MRIVIIEDEAFTARDLADTIKDLREDYSIIGIISSVKEAIDFFANNKEVDLVFSDIHLGDGLSFEIFKTGICKSPVIFCTAYDNYAIQAFRANGVDYVLKPIDKKNILEAIEKYERISHQGSNVNSMMNDFIQLFNKPKEDSKARSILVHHKDKIIPFKLEDIAILYIRNESTWIIDENGKSFPINESLEDIEQMELPFLFRANRQFLINRKAVKEATQHFARKLIVNLNVPFSEQISISKEKAPVFLKWLQDL
jgi:two-component system response regulator LytT